MQAHADGAGETVARDGMRRRRLILEGAVQVFAELGFAGASLRELAAGAGMQKGHLTYYFHTKEDLLYELVTDLLDQFIAGITEWAREHPADDEAALRCSFERHAQLVFDLHSQTRVAYDNFRFLTTERREAAIAQRDHYERHLAEKIGACRAAGVAIVDLPDRLLTKVVLGILNWPYQWYSPRGAMARDELAQHLAARALASLRPEPA